MISKEGVTVSETKDRKMVLSTLWMFVTLNYIYADIVTMIANPTIYQKAANLMTPGAVLALAVLMEVPIAMVLLSRVLKHKINRWMNIFAGIESSAFVAITVHGPMATPYYMFFAAIEIGCTLFIVWYAWTWSSDTHG